ncbi:hypothetical protein CUJ84_Chr004293 [Rhizobium leguminosarum]|uniref:Uncharacterized protein n=1 Tax=Rhizobium leguminosarum TaxID=384 RepID=A0A2K9Z8P2_RHILE|nr:hypothetical protein CUJ84_Chr004293 [Rhizobium leguminosarum]
MGASAGAARLSNAAGRRAAHPDVAGFTLALSDYYCATPFSAVDINGSFNTFCQRSASIKHLACVY